MVVSTCIQTEFKPADYEGLKENEQWFTAECERLHVVTMGAGDDIQFGDLDTRPLYREIENSSPLDPLSKCDLVHWFSSCYKDINAGSSAVELAAWIFITADSEAVILGLAVKE